jgi:16S rRNA (cytosine1402-N4)-methyltransferase
VHQPVMLEEAMHYLSPRKGQVQVDCTVGEGGHSAEIVRRIGEEGMLVGIDKDEEILSRVRNRFAGIANVQLVHGDFRSLREILTGLGFEKVNGVLFDLGVSSYHFETPARGFSFSGNGPLDMRLDRSQERTAEDLVNDLPESELAGIIRDYGEEPRAKRIARFIAAARKDGRITTTNELKELVISATGGRRGSIHTATRTFQALRIAVNDELASLSAATSQLPEVLGPGGRAVAISFHSLEDRIVKRALRDLAATGLAKVLTRKPVLPSREEVERNSRSRSAKLRALEVLQ